MFFKPRIFIFILLNLFSATTLATTNPSDKLIVTPCMFKALKGHAQLLSTTKQFNLIKTTLNDEVLQILHTQSKTCGKFLNLEAYETKQALNKTQITKLLTQLTSVKTNKPQQNFSIHHETEVLKLLEAVDPSKIWQSSQHLTSYNNRAANQKTGVDAAHWFKQQFDTMAQEAGQGNNVDSYFVATGNRYKQPSVVTVIGKGKTKEALVIGAHIDTLNGTMPGADDDASGISVVLEVARVLLSSNRQFDRPIYLVAYAAEEQGLVGSSYVVNSFIEKKIPVKAVMQLDQAGYRANPKDKTIWLLTDYVDTELTKFTAELLSHYVKVPVAYTLCGYACSDHANWTLNGFSATYPSATTLDDDNPYLHSPEDRLEILSLEHMVHFTKLGLAFVGELG